jgi:two-component system response regulator FlrC
MSNPKILLVDDEPLIRRSLQKTLFRAGFEVFVAGDCPEGLEKFEEALKEEPFQLAVFDLNMPGFEGFPIAGAGLELITRVKELDPAVPVIVLTAYDEVAKAKDAVSRGASAYFVKGREQGLIELIKETLGGLK